MIKLQGPSQGSALQSRELKKKKEKKASLSKYSLDTLNAWIQILLKLTYLMKIPHNFRAYKPVLQPLFWRETLNKHRCH